MRLQARLFPLGEESGRVLTARVPPEAQVFVSARCAVAVDDPILPQILAARLRGWHFRPVLTTESDVYTEYAANWRRLVAAVTSTMKSTFDGGRW